MASPARPDIGPIHTVGVPVADQDRALRFFTESLGFVVALDVPLPGGTDRWVTVGSPGGAAPTLALVAAGPDRPVGVDTGVRFATSTADSTHAALRERGITVGDLLRWPGVPAMFVMHDPDGNQYEIVETNNVAENRA